jgi:hypothetical protein
MVKLIALFSLAGLVIPILLTLLWKLLERYQHAYLSIGGVLEILQLLVWPSSIFMMATAGHKGIGYGMLALSITGNIVFYALLGFLIWWGLHKQRWMLYFAIGLLILIWYKLLTL